jgi:hypothetical protein
MCGLRVEGMLMPPKKRAGRLRVKAVQQLRRQAETRKLSEQFASILPVDLSASEWAAVAGI